MLYERYKKDLSREGFRHDRAQETAIRELQRIFDELLATPAPTPPKRRGLLSRFKNQPEQRLQPVRGLYLWGGVGRGKTYLVDLFFEALPLEKKQRIHFHRFMYKVHSALHKLQEQQDPLQSIARQFAEQSRLLCLDEFFVADITDAMLLAGLLEALFSNGVTLITTSNIPPDALYKDGLQRARFLPAIDLLKQHTAVLRMDGGTDYRLLYLKKAAVYHHPLDDKTAEMLRDTFEHVSPEAGQAGVVLEVENRPIPTQRLADGVVWFDFQDICDGPRSQADYLEIARCFHTVLVANIPVMDWQMENQARRFLNLVDVFYDHGVKLIITAAAPAEQLYQGDKLKFEYQRTLSRLQEMQAHDYLAKEHLP
ncbi:MAG: cell division protein ZapE [Candidatus Competibacteraceae bacterium]|jgi:cell division protein ZapE|nr:cell division protein ZapE [Candidatus Competibacteraceae bacterium]